MKMACVIDIVFAFQNILGFSFKTGKKKVHLSYSWNHLIPYAVIKHI